MEDFILRIGTYFLVIGTGLFILFVASDLAQNPDFDYLFWAVLIIVVGIFIRRRKPAPPPSGRFGLLRRMREGKKKEEPKKK
jgi:hypothetical protein